MKNIAVKIGQEAQPAVIGQCRGLSARLDMAWHNLRGAHYAGTAESLVVTIETHPILS